MFFVPSGSECGNKLLRYARLHNARTNSDRNANKDVFHRDMITGEFEIASIMVENSKSMRKRRSTMPPPSLPKLPTITRPFILNHEEFIFEDRVETDPEDYDIFAADTDEEALNAKTDGEEDEEEEEESDDESVYSTEEEEDDDDLSSVSF